MKQSIVLGLALLVASSVLAADSSTTSQPKNVTVDTNQLQSAITKLKGQANYSWTAKIELPSMDFTPGPVKGQTEKDGYTLVSQEMNDNTLQVAFKGDKIVMKTENQWQMLDDVEGFGAMLGWMLARTRTAAEEAENLLNKAKSLKAGDDGMLSGDLTDEGAKELLSFGPRRPNAQNAPPPPKNAKASVKFWLKDGALSKFVAQVKGTVAFGPDQEGRDFESIRTVEIQNVGTTKVELPAEAKKKLESK